MSAGILSKARQFVSISSSKNLVPSVFISSSKMSTFETLAVTTPKPFVYHVELNRADRLNAFNRTMWSEINKCFDELDLNPDCRVVILSGAGKHFTAGIDLQDMMKLGGELAEFEDVARKAKFMMNMIKNCQNSISSLENCSKPVLAAVHSACVGAGVDLITAADLRYCTQDAWFQVKEVEIGMAADVGTLQRLPKVIGNNNLVRELCFTGRKFQSKEAFECGLIGKVLENKESLLSHCLNLAEEIASKSPVAVQMTKKSIIYSMDHTNQEGLDHIAAYNQTLLQSEDFINACMAQAMKGEKPVFSKL
ncbi:delta(3,5)-Delta(2,4)-dienoyl-CoA isomerase, mitochondrial-like [Ctenocephalides felis]|uniref:delta(3,5)-Delta(2,4)-dienoyl-CoA isomerase, mitochondrial-like n=1 Tax=Ctenocephalides felis TaxID=7515 RepID=UPI000E6E2B47|nr:delta(3,5)-Delta(2,4)-dienoyl-CoA isomerase, mitochondrial-like [Ctenocephalides felis]